MTVRRYSSAQTFLDEDDPDVPGVLVLDVRMPGMSGIELQAELKRRKIDLPVIFLSAHGDIEMAAEAVRAGAMNFLVKPPKPEKLLALIREAVAKSIEDRRGKRYGDSLEKLWETLTPAERQVAVMVAKGLGNAVVAEALCVAERTVRSHKESIYRKLEVENAVELSDFLRDLDTYGRLGGRVMRRRDLIGLGLGLASSKLFCAPSAAWDLSCDVAVAGGGGAGLSAALAAAQNGAKVIVLEKNPQDAHISNTRMSGGIFHCPFKDDDPKALKEYAKAMFSGENIEWKEEGEIPEYSDDLAQVWADLSPSNLEFMQSLDPEFIGGSQPGFGKASFPNFPSAKECRYNAYRATYTKRMKNFNQVSYKCPKNETSSGEAFWLCLEEGVKKQGSKIKVVWEAPACELLKNAKGEIVGAAAVKGGKKLYVRAKKAVVLCTGGYEYSRAEGPGINGWAFYGTTSNTGDGISMGMAVGAGLQKAGKSAARVIVPTQKRFNGMRLGSITPAVGSTNGASDNRSSFVN